MTTEEEIFSIATALPPQERAAYLNVACEQLPQVRTRVEALLVSHCAGDFMHDRTLVLSPPDLLRRPDLPADEQTGKMIGRYRLLQQIGEGGFGVVWMAEQTEPVSRRVALKIIKAGMDTKEVIARFEAERQALAMMDHPCIARVFDAGATDKGRPYFVMELVKGIPVTQFCDEQQLTSRQRLQLFVEICAAINHAHQKGVIHRDIKPSNIMVALHGDRPLPKMIDFGIAKATEGRLTDRTAITGYEQFVGTPAYMSPEQTALSGIDVDTRSDIYSLGILLYELLTGKPPFDTKSLLSAGYEEMRRIIREVDPPRPSTRLATCAGVERQALAMARQVTPEKLNRTVESDLDWIVMKAIEKNRIRRYETADALAHDIERFLNDEPVIARPPTSGYRLWKFAQRNKVPLGAALGVAVSLSTAAILTTWHSAGIAAVLIAATALSTLQAVRATLAEKTATRKTTGEKTAREEAEALAEFLTGTLQSPDPARDGRTIAAAELLDIAGGKLEGTHLCEPGRKALFQGVLGRTYHSLGLHREAIPLLENRLNYMQRTFGPRHPHSLYAVQDLALTYQSAGRWAEALQMQEDVLKLNRQLNGPEHADTLESLRHLAESYHRSDCPAKALEMRKRVLTLLHRVKGAEHPLTIHASWRVTESFMNVGDYRGEAMELAESTLALSRRVLGPEHPDTIAGIHILAHCMEDLGAWKEALVMREEEAALRQRIHGPNHSATIHSLSDLARCYYNTGRIDHALQLKSEALLRSRRTLGSEHPHTILTALETASFHISAGRREQTVHLLAEVASRQVDSTRVLLDIAALQAWLGLHSDHIATCRRLAEKTARSSEPSSAYRAAIACCLRPLQEPPLTANALALARRAVAEGRKEPDLPAYQLCLGIAEFRHGNPVAALDALAAAEEGARKLKMPYERARIECTARCYRVMALCRQEKEKAAHELYSLCRENMRPLPSPGQHHPEVIHRNDIILWLGFKEAAALLKPRSPRISRRHLRRTTRT